MDNFYFETEFIILEKTNPDAPILKLKEEVKNIVKKFGESGQSGGSAPYTAHAIYAEIKSRVFRNVLIETVKDKDSLSYEFDKEIEELCNKIKNYNLQEGVKEISEQVRKICLYEPISPITGIEEEWNNVSDINNGEPWFQNKRCSALFKNGKSGKPYYIDAIIKRDQNGTCWSGFAWLNEDDYKTGDKDKMIGKIGFIKSFPFTPKTFYIDVRDVEVAKDDWESFVVDYSQLKQIWEYYDKN